MKKNVSTSTKLMLLLAPCIALSLSAGKEWQLAYPFGPLNSKDITEERFTALFNSSLACPTNPDYQIPCCPQPPKNLSMTFDDFLLAVTIAPTNAEKNDIIISYIAEVCEKNNGWPLVEWCKKGEKSLVNFVFRAEDTTSIVQALVAGDWNAFGGGSVFGPRPNEQNLTMNRISLGGEFPDFFYFRFSFENTARLDYKMLIDGSFIFDPLNPLATPGVFGGNSTLVMPEYCPQPGFRYYEDIKHGVVLGADNIPLNPKASSPIDGNPSIDQNNENRALETINPFIIPDALTSPYIDGALRDQGYWVYLPAEYNEKDKRRYPVIYFLNGQQYLQFGNMNNVLDYLIAHKIIEPVIAIFCRQDNCVTINNTECTDGFYNAPNYDAVFVYDTDADFINTLDENGKPFQPIADYLINKLIPEIDRKYNTKSCAKGRTIVGVSSTGNQALFLILGYPDTFKNATVQSLIYDNANKSQPTVDDFIQGSIDEGTPPEETPPTAYRHGFIIDEAGQLNYLDSFFPKAKGQKIYFNWGSYENPSLNLLGFGDPMTLLNNEVCQFLQERTSVKCVETIAGNGWGQWPSQVELALPTLLKGKYKKKNRKATCCSHKTKKR